MLAAAPKAGVLSIIRHRRAGNESDLLAGELDIHADAHADAAAHDRDWQAHRGLGARRAGRRWAC